MKVAIHQPQYWPWPPYVHKILSADVFVYLDTVQFSKNGFQNRNQIKTPQGAFWLTLPVKHQFGQSIQEVEIAHHKALRKHFRTLQANYAGTPGFQRWREELQALLEVEPPSLCDVAIETTEWMLNKLEAPTKRVRASALTGLEGEASKLVASICASVQATSYLTGTGALEYMDPADFAEVGCEICVQKWTPFEYEQAHPEAGFVPHLSTLDLLLNCPDSAGALIGQAGGWRPLASVPER